MDKLKLFTPFADFPKHILKTEFECCGVKHLPKGLKIYHYIDRLTGVTLNDLPNGFTLEFNPTKFLKGNNFEQINRIELIESVQKLSDLYRTNFNFWEVSGFDFNSNLELEHKPALYINYLGSLKNWTQIIDVNGKTYHTKSNTKGLIFYDKSLEFIKRKQDIPIQFENKNILRIEASINKEISKIKALEKMKTMSNFTTKENYQQLPKLWLSMYEEVEKNEKEIYLQNLTKKENDMLTAIEKYTLNGYRNKLKIEYPKQFPYHFKQLEKLVEKVKEFRIKNGIISLMDELNSKMKVRANQLILEA